MIIIIAEISKSVYSLAGYVNVMEKITCEFNTEYLTEAHKKLLEKYEGYEIEILYVFDSIMNEKIIFDYILNKGKNEKDYPTTFYKCNCILCNELHTATKVQQAIKKESKSS